ncbi:MAG: hypothetical protein HZA01_09145 [Nitrospinae bacterium]|nr:hypothetical protein [Nitrospinota bacterium]
MIEEKAISDEEFQTLVDLVYREAGIMLQQKRDLVNARLATIEPTHKLKNNKSILKNPTKSMS